MADEKGCFPPWLLLFRCPNFKFTFLLELSFLLLPSVFVLLPFSPLLFFFPLFLSLLKFPWPFGKNVCVGGGTVIPGFSSSSHCVDPPHSSFCLSSQSILGLVDQQNTFSSSSKDKKKAKNLSGSFTARLKED
jgi:hypothetical protein